MRALHDALQQILTDVPREVILGKIVDRKLQEKRVSLSERDRKQLIAHIAKGAVGALTLGSWEWWKSKDVLLEFTAEDATEIERFSESLVSEIPDILESVSATLAESILSTLKRSWPKESRSQHREQRSFQKEIARQWSAPLELLRMLLTMAREYGESINEEVRSSGGGESPHLAEVLTRLQARACQLTGEVIALLEAGFPDGAISRWRSLHEVAAVAMFIGDGGDELAERYLLHEAIESWRAAREYQSSEARLDLEPISSHEFAALEKRYRALVDRFGAPFKEQYGWAARKLGIPRPTFADIERAAGVEHLRPLYRMASHSVHANPKGVFIRLGLLEDEDILLSGPSHVGLGEPGHYAAASLLQACAALVRLSPNYDNIICVRLMSAVLQEVGRAFASLREQVAEHVA